MFRALLKNSAIKLDTRHYSNRNIMKLHERGMYEDLFPMNSNNEITDLLNAKPQCVYAGFDPTADSLHVGNLLILMNLLHWQRGGHRVVALVGGATGRIGDPSERTTDRPQLKSDLLNKNVSLLRENILKIFNNHKEYIWKKELNSHTLTELKIVDNSDWYSEKNVIDFISQVGRHFRMGTMLGRNSAQSRLNSESGMSFTEFCYPVFQAYDWLHLLQTYNCRFQVGGHDQMGNIVAGHDLISRVSNTNVYGLTLPLITTEAGLKFGKSVGNAVWLNADRSSPFELYQFFVRSRDAEVEKLLKLFTFESLGNIANIMKFHQQKPEQRIAQKKLAERVTLLVHGEEGLESALKSTEALYQNTVESLINLTTQEIESAFKGAKICEMLLNPGITTMELALQAGCFPTEGEAIRIISAGGFYINHQRISKTDEVLTHAAHILPNNVSLLRVGKKNYYVVKWMK